MTDVRINIYPSIISVFFMTDKAKNICSKKTDSYRIVEGNFTGQYFKLLQFNTDKLAKVEETLKNDGLCYETIDLSK